MAFDWVATPNTDASAFEQRSSLRFSSKIVHNKNRTKSSPSFVDDVNHRELMDKMLARMRSEVIEKRLPITDCFRQYDHLRQGSVPCDKFAVALTYAGLSVSHAELEALQRAYATERLLGETASNRVSYVKLCNQLEAAPRGSEGEKAWDTASAL